MPDLKQLYFLCRRTSSEAGWGRPEVSLLTVGARRHHNTGSVHHTLPRGEPVQLFISWLCCLVRCSGSLLVQVALQAGLFDYPRIE